MSGELRVIHRGTIRSIQHISSSHHRNNIRTSHFNTYISDLEKKIRPNERK